jgi:hypothetical protein
VSLPEKTLERLTEVDACENALVVLAHDASLWNIIDFYPREAKQ